MNITCNKMMYTYRDVTNILNYLWVITGKAEKGF